MGNISNKDLYPNETAVNRTDYLIGSNELGISKTFQLDALQSLLDTDGYTVAQMATMISNSLLLPNVTYKITDAGSGDEAILIEAATTTTFFKVCRKISDLDSLYVYDYGTDTLSAFTANVTVLDENNYASNSATQPPSQASVKYNDDILKGDATLTGAALTFTKKDQTYNAGTPSSAATITIDGTGAIANSTAVFVSDGTEITSIVGAGAETIRTTKGDQPTGEAGFLVVFYDGTAYWPTWRNEIAVLDEDTMASDSATKPPSQKSTATFVRSLHGTETTGGTISFDKNYIHNTPLTPLTGDITLSDTNAIVGSTAFIYHQQTTAPSITYGNFTLDGSAVGEYQATDPSTLNVIIITNVGGGYVAVTYRNGLGMNELVDDTTPVLGGDLDAGNFDITNVTDIEIQGQAYSDGEVDNGNSSTADTIDWTAGNFQKSTLTDTCTYTFTAPTGATTLILKVVQDGTGSRTVTWPATVYWSGGTAPTLSTAANSVDIITFYFDGTNYHGAAILDLQ